MKEVDANKLADLVAGIACQLQYMHNTPFGAKEIAPLNEAASRLKAMQSRLEELNQKVEELEKENDSLQKDATRYQDFKANSHIRFSLFSGRYRADDGHSILTDWLESFDECFDAAIQASKQ